ncbi:MAG: hypothetical protein N2746_09365 [Deltaproteobacteria bacterium]|nr:hypothetical protein [Deltaproteobacteria bacterium]
MKHRIIILIFVSFVVSNYLFGEEVLFDDPIGDDKGPGSYIYPTDSVYKKGSFDISRLEVREKGEDVEFKLTVNAKIEDPWNSKSWPQPGNGFSIQMAFVFIDMDHKEGSGEEEGLPGLNIKFEKESFYEKCIVLSPQSRARINDEIKLKAEKFKERIVVPKRTFVQGRSIIAIVPKKDLGGFSTKWGFQVIMQSNEGYPDKKDFLTRKVNEYEGPHRFGGGSDYDCDPHVIDIIVAPAKGGKEEIEKQYEILKGFKCDPDPSKWEIVRIPMVYR